MRRCRFNTVLRKFNKAGQIAPVEQSEEEESPELTEDEQQ